MGFYIWVGVISFLLLSPQFWSYAFGMFRLGGVFILVGLVVGATMEGIRWTLDGLFGPLDYRAFFNAHDLATVCGRPDNTGACPYLDNGEVAIVIALVAVGIVLRWLVKRHDRQIAIDVSSRRLRHHRDAARSDTATR